MKTPNKIPILSNQTIIDCHAYPKKYPIVISTADHANPLKTFHITNFL